MIYPSIIYMTSTSPSYDSSKYSPISISVIITTELERKNHINNTPIESRMFSKAKQTKVLNTNTFLWPLFVYGLSF